MANRAAALALAVLAAALLLAHVAAAAGSLEDEFRNLLRQLEQQNTTAAPVIPLGEAVKLYTGLAKCSADPAVGADALRAADVLQAMAASGYSRAALAQWQAVTQLLIRDVYRAALNGLLRSCSAETVYYALLYANAVPMKDKLIVAGFNPLLPRTALAEALKESGLPSDVAEAAASLVASDPATAAAAAAIAARPSPGLWELVARQAGSAEGLAALVALADPSTIPPTAARLLLARIVTETSPDVAALGPSAWLIKAGVYYDEAIEAYAGSGRVAAKPLVLYLALTKLLEQAYPGVAQQLAKLPTYTSLYRTVLQETPPGVLDAFKPLGNSTLDLETLAKAWYAVKTNRPLLAAARDDGLDPIAASAALWTSKEKWLIDNLVVSSIYVNASRSPACEAAANLVKQAVAMGPYAGQALWAHAAAAAALCASDTGSAKPIEALLTIQPLAAPSPSLLRASSLHVPGPELDAIIKAAEDISKAIPWTTHSSAQPAPSPPRLSPGWVSALIRRGDAEGLIHVARSLGDRALIDVASRLASEAAQGSLLPPAEGEARARETAWVLNELSRLKTMASSGEVPGVLRPVLDHVVASVKAALRRGDIESAAAELITIEQLINDYKAIEDYTPSGPKAAQQAATWSNAAPGPSMGSAGPLDARLVEEVLSAARQARLVLERGGSTSQLPETLRGKNLDELVQEALRLVHEGALKPEDVKPLLDLAQRLHETPSIAQRLPKPQLRLPHLPAPRPITLGGGSPSLGMPSMSVPGPGSGAAAALGLVLAAAAAAALLAKRRGLPSLGPRLRRLRGARRGGGGGRGSGSPSPRELVVELFRELLMLYGRLVRPKRPYETHREYSKAVPVGERSLYAKAAMIYEEAKFSQHPIGRQHVETMTELLKHAEKLHEQGGVKEAGEQ